MGKRNFVNLNVNPCKMCMPMGAATAFKGVEKTIMLLHGSQGCSTYIRRHMASHYNEPIDIASSSLNEKGTVYGGAGNLKRGLLNVIRLYNPSIIGVATSCLAETIGEDIIRITQEFQQENSIGDIEIITVPTPGYGGSQFEGYYLTLRRIVEHVVQTRIPNQKINIIAGNLTPADIRHIKEIIEGFSIGYIMLPDISETLDAPYNNDYKRLPDGGTTLSDIKEMGGAIATIEMGLLVGEEFSPGKYLEDEFGVPLYRCPLPIGLENTDWFIRLLSKLSGVSIPAKLKKARNRMLDAMIDSHKYNAEGRAAIFGEPEMVYTVTTTCLENGVFPAIVTTGSKAAGLEKLLLKGFEKYAQESIVIDDTDFDTIRKYIKKLGANILIGHSDGKVITDKDAIPLVRIGFPIHDRMGAQRKLFVGYEGTMRLIDEITNTLLEQKYACYRKETTEKYYT